LSDDADIWIAGESLERGVGVYYYNESIVRGGPGGAVGNGRGSNVTEAMRRCPGKLTQSVDGGDE
jgi:hypothetical protein